MSNPRNLQANLTMQHLPQLETVDAGFLSAFRGLDSPVLPKVHVESAVARLGDGPHSNPPLTERAARPLFAALALAWLEQVA